MLTILIGLVIPLVLAAATFLLGFRVGGEHWQSELARIRMEAAKAERQVHDLTRQAFVAMAEAADRHHPHGDGTWR